MKTLKINQKETSQSNKNFEVGDIKNNPFEIFGKRYN